jgi:hypothetical protein
VVNEGKVFLLIVFKGKMDLNGWGNVGGSYVWHNFYKDWEDFLKLGYPYLKEKLDNKEVAYWCTSIISQDEVIKES